MAVETAMGASQFGAATERYGLPHRPGKLWRWTVPWWSLAVGLEVAVSGSAQGGH